MKRIVLITIATWLTALQLSAQSMASDSISSDTVTLENTDKPKKISLLRRIIREFDRLDTAYIEPQHYLFTVMLQSTYTYDYYTLRSSENGGQTVSFSPGGSIKVGPYFGWKWFFAGYSFSLGHSTFDKTKTQIDLSVYSSQIGLDLFYRRTGSNYKLQKVNLGNGIDASALENVPFDGIQAGITGFSAYYIFNHGRFSYPAAFAQSTQQKISCGSWMAGIGYTLNTLEFDYEKLAKLAAEKLAPQVLSADSSLMFNSAEYHDLSLSGGYAYNWVFAKNWLLCASGQLAMAYKLSMGETLERRGENHFSFTNISPNLVGRFALVYNNMRWYVGASAIVRSNYYFETRFSTQNTFGYFNLYAGYNFGLKKKYKKKK